MAHIAILRAIEIFPDVLILAVELEVTRTHGPEWEICFLCASCRAHCEVKLYG